MKKKILLLGISILIIILLLVGVYYYGFTPVSRKSEEVEFKVNAGDYASTVISNLKSANIIRSEISSKIYIKLNNNLVVKPGTYKLNRNMTTLEIFEILNEGEKKETIRITFKEGKRVIDYVEQISEATEFTKDEILSAILDREYLKELIEKYSFLSDNILNSDIYYPLEGYLFPATYDFYIDASIKEIIEKMLDKTQNVLDNYSTLLQESEYNIHEILTMASIIENESMFDEDRSKVSEVIYKRLDYNMSLGMDVTTFYGVRKSLKEELTKSDLASVNGYNTRVATFKGLPVGPICNPSEKSIEAALKPSSDNYLYFYADIKTGHLYFAENYSDFQKLIQKYS